MASHLTLEYFGMKYGAYFLWLQNQPQIITPPTCDLKFIREVCADMLCLVFSKRGAVHYDQTSPL